MIDNINYQFFGIFPMGFSFSIKFFENYHISEKTVMSKKANELVNHFEFAITSVRLCAECYSNSIRFPKKWITMVCSKPHLILWAKANDWDHWPALLMHINGNDVEVRFFGDYTKAVIPATDCFLYSDTNPSLISTGEWNNRYKLALNVNISFIINIFSD